MKYFIFISMLISTSSYANLLCNIDEKLITGCELRNGKTVSFCANKNELLTYRYGSKSRIELSLTEHAKDSMILMSEIYSRGVTTEYQAINGKYQYNFINGLYGDNDATYLLMELYERGFDIPWLNERTLSHHVTNKNLTVSHETKGELVSILCKDDSHFYGTPHREVSYIHIMRNNSDKYNLEDADSKCDKDKNTCVQIYEDYKQDFTLIYFLPLENGGYINNKVFLIKSKTGDITEIPLSPTIKNHSKTIKLTLDGQYTAISIDTFQD